MLYGRRPRRIDHSRRGLRHCRSGGIGWRNNSVLRNGASAAHHHRATQAHQQQRAATHGPQKRLIRARGFCRGFSGHRWRGGGGSRHICRGAIRRGWGWRSRRLRRGGGRRHWRGGRVHCRGFGRGGDPASTCLTRGWAVRLIRSAAACLLRLGSGTCLGDALFNRGGRLHDRRARLKHRGCRHSASWHRASRRRRGRRRLCRGHCRRTDDARLRRGRGRGRGRNSGRHDVLRQQRRCGKGQNSGDRGPGGADGANMSSHSGSSTIDWSESLHELAASRTNRKDDKAKRSL